MAERPENKPVEPVGKQVAKEAAQTSRSWEKVAADVDAIIAEVESQTAAAENTQELLTMLYDLRKTVAIDSRK